ncbi:LysR family transcriptional regulator [Kibdelosporangium philippinense]|uniref:LysR family transcriptional regulator n=1 Tax=Kibdelosporangium philippinense TaxID=211113 RepID=A0ABS8ZK37_9PSEU|nr:LysR family transcriptional regulator [Kibdelosporangium philippinense]MCE7008159.1 LysR family transcriptional regulator [Kibdelosporangium philippinense]
MVAGGGARLLNNGEADKDILQIRLSQDDMDLLKAVAETNSVAAAGKRLRISQPTVRRQLARLEHRIGAELAIRADEHLRLTRAGLAVLAAARRFQATLADVVHRLVDMPSGSPQLPRPVLRMAFFGRNWEDFVDDTARRLEGFVVDVTTAPRAQGIDMFEQHAVDAVYGWTYPQQRRRFSRRSVAHDVLSDTMWVSLPAGHRCANDAEVSLEDLRDDRWIVVGDERAKRGLAEICAPYGYSPEISHVVPSLSATRGLLWRGEGVALVSPLTLLPVAGSGFVTRPLRHAPKRLHQLVVDPLVINDGLAKVLCSALCTSYQWKAMKRNPRCLSNVDFHAAGSMPQAEEIGTDVSGALPGLTSSDNQSNLRLWPEDLHLLRVINNSGSLNRAAPQLLITQPALTRKVGRLERQLGARLLRRGHQGTALTPLARRLLAEVNAAQVEFDELLDDIKRGPRVPECRVSD